ncbi:MAG: SagB/ThcOx family dehydrogenase [Sulfurimonas sp.]
MNKDIQTVLNYHQTTKHSQQRYARSLGYMDWATQPNPFREYQGSEKVELPLSLENATPPYSLLDEDLPAAPLVLESLSQLLQFSMGIAAWKTSGDSSWAVRCNASSGNLHPTETYVILPPVLESQKDKSSVYHYAPKNHELELLASFKTSFWDSLAQDSFIIGLSSIVWREVWKYGERAFRYTQLDAGHAWQSFVVSAKMLGWTITRLDAVSHEDISKLMGLDQKNRFFESEIADMLFVVSPSEIASNLSINGLVEDLHLTYHGIANKLSPSMYEWDIIPLIEKATSINQIAQKSITKGKVLRSATQESKAVVMNRRSIHVMEKENSFITKEQFHTMLKSIANSQDGKENAVHLCIFVNRVQEYEAGLYILVRNPSEFYQLKDQINSAFSWEKTSFEDLYLLESSNLEMLSKSISCAQDIAGDGAFSLGMLCNYTQQLQKYGAHRYKELYWECGAIGQQLYLEATSMGLSGTGIGCFLDDMMHETLGLKSNRFQVLYHFTVGRGYVDNRILTKPAYAQKN